MALHGHHATSWTAWWVLMPMQQVAFIPPLCWGKMRSALETMKPQPHCHDHSVPGKIPGGTGMGEEASGAGLHHFCPHSATDYRQVTLVLSDGMCLWGEERTLPQQSAVCAPPSAQHSETGETLRNCSFLWVFVGQDGVCSSTTCGVMSSALNLLC